jgi:hypothetical protein
MLQRMGIIVDVLICVSTCALILRVDRCAGLEISVSEIARHGQELFREQNDLRSLQDWECVLFRAAKSDEEQFQYRNVEPGVLKVQGERR